MDWKRTIEQNRRALAGVIAGLIAMAGHGDPSRLPCAAPLSASCARRKSALRRPIVIVAATLRCATEDGPTRGPAGFCTLCPPGRATRLPADRSAQALRADKPTDRPCARHAAHQRAGPVRSRATPETGRHFPRRRIALLDHALKTLPRQAIRPTTFCASAIVSRSIAASSRPDFVRNRRYPPHAGRLSGAETPENARRERQPVTSAPRLSLPGHVRAIRVRLEPDGNTGEPALSEHGDKRVAHY